MDRRQGPGRYRQPVAPVTHNGVTYQIGQANNALVFPGIGLGVTVARARRITDPMIAAAAAAAARLANISTPGASPLPKVDELRKVSAAVAAAAASEGLARAPTDNLVDRVRQAMWRPEYPKIQLEPTEHGCLPADPPFSALGRP